MKKTLCLLFVIFVLTTTGCQPRPAKKPAQPPANTPAMPAHSLRDEGSAAASQESEPETVPGDVYKGYTLFSPLGSRETYLINNQGTVIHTWSSRFPVGSAVYLTQQGTLLRSEGMRPHQGTFSL